MCLRHPAALCAKGTGNAAAASTHPGQLGSEILRLICNQIERKVGHEMETGSLTGAYICICICNTGLRTIMED